MQLVLGQQITVVTQNKIRLAKTRIISLIFQYCLQPIECRWLGAERDDGCRMFSTSSTSSYLACFQNSQWLWYETTEVHRSSKESLTTSLKFAVRIARRAVVEVSLYFKYPRRTMSAPGPAACGGGITKVL